MSFIQDVKDLLAKAHTGLSVEESRLKAWFAHLFQHHQSGSVIAPPPQAGSAVAPTPGVAPTPVITAPVPAPAPAPNVQRANPLPIPAGATLVAVPGLPTCLVTLDLPPDAAQYGLAFAIQEIQESFPVGSPERTTIEANMVEANAHWYAGQAHAVMAVYPLGADGRTVDQSHPAAHTNALPPVDGYKTVAEAIATLSAIKRGDGTAAGPFVPVR